MFHRSNPRWTRLLLSVLVALVPFVATAAYAGNTHSEGGAVLEAPGVPETDGTASVQIYWSGDSATRTSVVSGATLAGYWLQDVGFALARPWLVGDEHTALLEFETGAGTTAHAGYYGVTTKVLTSLDPDEYPALTVRPIPVPVASAGAGFVDVVWNKAHSGGAAGAIAGYNVHRSTDGIAFTKLNSAVLADTTYRDASAAFGTTYQYAVTLAYGGTPVLQSSLLSASSAPVTPLDATPPDMPLLAALPPFTAGLARSLTWSNETASGATAYYAECALDSAFTSLVGNSGWIADTTATFSDLADGQHYFYRVRACDVAQNPSGFSPAAHSRQDATAPASHLLDLAAYKASSTVSLEWAATDSVSGVSGVQLYFSKDGAAYEIYAGGPFTTSPIAFDAATTGGDGLYAFYTRAADAVANTEEAPETPDASTRIDTQPPAIPVLASLPAFTPGLERGLSWSSAAASGAIEYRIEAALADDFASVALQSDWQA
ncbi:MAG: cbhB, partial [Myxococcaceae bacterium]|nr:cbhB [Myxococcaceae bacterium]